MLTWQWWWNRKFYFGYKKFNDFHALVVLIVCYSDSFKYGHCTNLFKDGSNHLLNGREIKYYWICQDFHVLILNTCPISTSIKSVNQPLSLHSEVPRVPRIHYLLWKSKPSAAPSIARLFSHLT